MLLCSIRDAIPHQIIFLQVAHAQHLYSLIIHFHHKNSPRRTLSLGTNGLQAFERSFSFSLSPFSFSFHFYFTLVVVSSSEERASQYYFDSWKIVNHAFAVHDGPVTLERVPQGNIFFKYLWVSRPRIPEWSSSFVSHFLLFSFQFIPFCSCLIFYWHFGSHGSLFY